MRNKTKPTAVREDKEPALVPKLRFPEFRGAKEWGNASLGDLSEVVRGGSPRPIDGFLTTAADGLNWLKIGDVDKEAKYVTNTAEKVRPEALSKTRVVNPGDLILSNSMSFGRPYILQIKTCIHDGWIAITDIAKKANRDFLYYSISAPSSQSYFVDNAAGSGVQNLNADIIKALPVCFPSPAEQQKIAECLSSIDELMATQARKVEALKEHKKGLMQQLFPREGETQPSLRFPEFQNAGEWEVKTVGDIFKVTRGEVLAMTLVHDEASNDMPYPVYSSQTKNKGLAGYYSDYLYRDAITWTTDGANAGDVNFRPGRFYCTNVCGVLLNTDGYANECVAALLNTVTRSHVSYVGNPKLMNGVMAKIEIPFPSVPEQQCIAECLSSIDALITAETQKQESIKTHKKGLMQQLFPIPEAT
jgi:type I restriction enzyme S subunit